MAKRLTTRQIVAELRKKGHRVRFRERPDGGLRIIKIDGREYKKSAGNRAARKMAKVSLSKQLSKALSNYRKEHTRKAKENKPPKDPWWKLTPKQQAELKKLNKQAERAGAKKVSKKKAEKLKRDRRGRGGWRQIIKDYKKTIVTALGINSDRAEQVVAWLESVLGSVPAGEQVYIQSTIDKMRRNLKWIDSETANQVWSLWYEDWFLNQSIDTATASVLSNLDIEEGVRENKRKVKEAGIRI